MKEVWKYPINTTAIADNQEIKIPIGSKLVHTGLFEAFRADLKACSEDDVELMAYPINNKSELSLKSKDCYAWKEDKGDGDTTDKTCEEILS